MSSTSECKHYDLVTNIIFFLKNVILSVQEDFFFFGLSSIVEPTLLSAFGMCISRSNCQFYFHSNELRNLIVGYVLYLGQGYFIHYSRNIVIFLPVQVIEANFAVGYKMMFPKLFYLSKTIQRCDCCVTNKKENIFCSANCIIFLLLVI